MKKIIAFIFSMLFIFVMQTKVNADAHERITINFSELNYTLDDYSELDTKVVYSVEGVTEVATIFDVNSGEVLETVEFIPDLFRSTIQSHTLRRSTSYGRTTVRLSVNVELYTNGSFRQINSIQGHYLEITNAIATTYFEGQNVNVWSPSGSFPTTSIKYAYNGTLIATVDSSISSSAKAELAGSGFSFSYTSGFTTYYRRPFSQNGTISLY